MHWISRQDRTCCQSRQSKNRMSSSMNSPDRGLGLVLHQSPKAKRSNPPLTRLEFVLRAYICQQRQADFWRALKEALHGISRSVETMFLARPARLPVPVGQEQSV